MKALVVILIIGGVFYLAQTLIRQYKKAEVDTGRAPAAEPAKAAPVPGTDLPGLDPLYEASLQAAKRQGPEALKKWLDQYRRSIADPRLADIELDYIILVSRRDPAEAKRQFQAVKARVPATSPVYPRVKNLEKTYQ